MKRTAQYITRGYQLKRLQSVLNAAARLVFSSPRRHHVSPLLRQLVAVTLAEGPKTDPV